MLEAWWRVRSLGWGSLGLGRLGLWCLVRMRVLSRDCRHLLQRLDGSRMGRIHDIVILTLMDRLCDIVMDRICAIVM